jgi:2-dehydropantoate 2-reductase
VSALHDKSLNEIGDDPELLKTVRNLMEECQLVGEKIGVKFNVSIDHRIKAAISIKGHKPSTTQDLHAKRPLEIDPIIGSIIEIGNKINVNTENLKSEYNKLKNKAEALGLYKRSKIIDQITN